MAHIGTPLSPSATRVMLLDCGELGKEIIIALGVALAYGIDIDECCERAKLAASKVKPVKGISG